MRGEDLKTTQDARPLEGSPPHARGRRRRSSRSLAMGRITPACAGKTLKILLQRCWRRGSPPHARGRLKMRVNRLRDGRITPACAGKTEYQQFKSKDHADHPRMRGEDRAGLMSRGAPKGSPPHARGRPWRTSETTPMVGITPACAGKTSEWKTTTPGRPDHPRMRGEDRLKNLSANAIHGSPPHARGRQSLTR